MGSFFNSIILMRIRHEQFFSGFFSKYIKFTFNLAFTDIQLANNCPQLMRAGF